MNGNIKKTIALIIVSLFLVMSVNVISTKVTANQLVMKNYEVFDDTNDDVRAFFILKGFIINKLFNYIDMLSFSIYEDAETPEFLYMKMRIGEVRFTELRSLYNIVWTFNDLMYCTGMHTLNSSETILNYSAYYEADGTEHKIWNTSLIIDEDNAVFIWAITKNDLGLKAGDVFKAPWAQAQFGTKSISHFLGFASDKIASGPDYVIQY